MSVITRAEIMRLTQHADARVADAFVANADVAFTRWSITTAPRLQMFMAHVAVESAWLTKLFESMSYTAPRLLQVYPTHFKSLADAEAVVAQGQEAIANRVYGGRMGNVGPNDGWLCRGQGLLQTTGLTNFTALAKHMGQTVEVTRARLTSDEGMVDSSAATFHMLGCNAFADKDDLLGCTKRINGGTNGLSDRQKAYALAKTIWPTMRPLQPALVASAIPAAPAPIVATGPHITGVAPAPAAPAPKGFWASLKAAFTGKAA